MVADPILVALRVAETLDACKVRYLVGGSLASAVSGEPRSTLDVDFVVALSVKDIEPLVSVLGDEFRVESDTLRRGVRDRSSANFIHLGTSTKVGLFIVGGSPLDEAQLARRQRIKVTSNPDRYLYFYLAEDILLQKLRWYQLGGETSDR